MKQLQWMVIMVLCYGVSHCSSFVKIELSVTGSQMTLTCLVQNRNPQLSIYLECPFGAICKENCKNNCFSKTSDQICMAEKMISCNDKGFDPVTQFYAIEYIINGSDSRNNGQWKCFHGILSSSVIHVDAVVQKFVSTMQPSEESWTKPLLITLGKSTAKGTILTDNGIPDNQFPNELNDNSLTNKSEFFLILIGMLVVSLIFNIFFFFRMIFVKHKRKNCRNDMFMQNQMSGKWPLYSCNSQRTDINDDELIDNFQSQSGINAPMDARQMSFLTTIKMANGSYVRQSNLAPSPGPSSTLVSSKYFPITVSHSPSFPGSSSNSSRKHLFNNNEGSAQIYFPFPNDENAATLEPTRAAFNCGPREINLENRYPLNYLKTISPELLRDRNPNRDRYQYSAFKSSNSSPISAATSRTSDQPSHISPNRSPSDIGPFRTSSGMKNNDFVTAGNVQQPNNYYAQSTEQTIGNLNPHLMDFTDKDMGIVT